MLTLTTREAETRFNKFEALFNVAQQEPVTITDGGKTLLVIVAPDELQRMIQEQSNRNQAVAEYDAYLARIRTKVNPAVNELTDENVNCLVHEAR